MTQRQAVIFDMDGVIVDSEPRHERAFLEVVRHIGFGESSPLRFADYIGRSDQELWVDFIARCRPRQTLEELLALKRTRVLELLRRVQPLCDGLPQLVARLAGSYSLALASGSERVIIDEVLSLGSLREFITVAVTASDVPQGKPAPDIFLRAAALIGKKPQDCWVIEDSKPGINAGLAAGMQVIAITNTYPAAELAHATYVVSSYSEIEALLLPAP
jgi:beta-phosphoglucomutase-like phosphatase (HAD superfamily)